MTKEENKNPEEELVVDEKKQDQTALEKITSTTPATKKGKTDYETIAKDDIKSGMVIRIHQKIVDTNPKGEEKERVQVFQGMVLARKHGREAGATITVRKISDGLGVERILPLNLPSLIKFELVKKYKTRQARPYYLRDYKKKLEEIK